VPGLSKARYRPIAIATLLLAACCGTGAPPTAVKPPAHPGDGSAITRTACDALTGADRARATGLLASLYIHDCCDEPLDRCLIQKPRCRLAVRLAENVCRRVASGQDDERIRKALSMRARMAAAEQAGQRAAIDLGGWPAAGDAAAPIEVVVYADPRGPHCARMVPLIHAAVTSGALAGKARLYLKPFPLRSNPYSKEAGLAFLAAQELGDLWGFVLYSYARFDLFAVEIMPEWAAAAGLDRTRFEQLIADPALTARLVASKQEGVDNGVTSTPWFFFDGRFYEGELEIDEIVDTILEIHDRQGLAHEP
jgi:protein-disulfide isomerase